MNVALFRPADPAPKLDTVLAAGWAALARFGLTPASDGDARDFFGCVGRVEALLRRRDQPELAAAIAEHTAYLATKRALADVTMLSAVTQPHDILTQDAIHNITAILQQVPEPRRAVSSHASTAAEARSTPMPPQVVEIIEAAERELEGWCTRTKSLAMAQLVLDEKPNICVEIGIYGGRSLVPCAAALQANGAGRIYGIECWDPSSAVRNATDEVNDAWWLNVDFAAVKRSFLRFIVERQLTREVCIVEAASRDAGAMFSTIDFLHIDGSHAVIGAAEDVLLYATKVRKGGIIVFDDTEWKTTLPAQQMLEALGHPLMTQDEVRAANYAIFRRT